MYQHANYNGIEYHVCSDNKEVPMKDNMSSIRIGKNVAVTLYDHAGYKGRTISFADDTPSMGKFKFNDKMASVKLIKKSDCITVYEHSNYKGLSYAICDDLTSLSADNFNDKISSIKVHDNYPVIFEHSKFNGKYFMAYKDVKNLKDINFNDKVSSIKIVKKDCN